MARPKCLDEYEYEEPKPICRVAYHEAGHAVCMWHLGVDLAKVFIRRSIEDQQRNDESNPGWHGAACMTREERDAEKLGKIAWAGLLAEAKHIACFGLARRDGEADSDIAESLRFDAASVSDNSVPIVCAIDRWLPSAQRGAEALDLEFTFAQPDKTPEQFNVFVGECTEDFRAVLARLREDKRMQCDGVDKSIVRFRVSSCSLGLRLRMCVDPLRHNLKDRPVLAVSLQSAIQLPR